MILATLAFLLQVQTSSLPKLEQALLGAWVGTLEYRDYSDDSRERLPTLLRVSRSADADSVVMRYVFDDGPKKVIQDSDLLCVDEAKRTYTLQSVDGKTSDIYRMEGYERLRSDGTGRLVLIGNATENQAPVEVRETVTLEQSKLEILRETRLPGRNFAFRHVYRFQRVTQPNAAGHS